MRDPRRHIELKGAQNVRDLGGYTTKDGRLTQWGRFLRSDGMHLLTEADQEKLLDYGVGTVIDLRMKLEVEATPNVFSRSARVDFHHLNLMANLEKGVSRRRPDPGRLRRSLPTCTASSYLTAGRTWGESWERLQMQAIMHVMSPVNMGTLADAGDHACYVASYLC